MFVLLADGVSDWVGGVKGRSSCRCEKNKRRRRKKKGPAVASPKKCFDDVTERGPKRDRYTVSVCATTVTLNHFPSRAVVFIAGSFMYKKTPPQGNILLKVCKCIGVGHLPLLPALVESIPYRRMLAVRCRSILRKAQTKGPKERSVQRREVQSRVESQKKGSRNHETGGAHAAQWFNDVVKVVKSV